MYDGYSATPMRGPQVGGRRFLPKASLGATFPGPAQGGAASHVPEEGGRRTAISRSRQVFNESGI